MRRDRSSALHLSLALVVLAPASAGAQILSLGGRVAYNTDIQDGTLGLGAQAVLSAPLVGLRVQGTADFFFPDCGADCGFQDFGANLLFGLPLPALDPYFGAGAAIQNAEGALEGIGDDSDYGVNLVAGVGFGGVFVEGRYQLMKDFPDQLVLAGGFTVPIL